MNNSTIQYQIVAYCCKHCAYAAADLAGGLRMQYPPAVKIIELPCTGRVDLAALLQAFEQGADGIMVAGWLPGDCHYLEGNAHAKSRVKYLQSILSSIGIHPDRVQMVNVSAAMAAEFTKLTAEMAAQLQEIGQNPLKELE